MEEDFLIIIFLPRNIFDVLNALEKSEVSPLEDSTTTPEHGFAEVSGSQGSPDVFFVCSAVGGCGSTVWKAEKLGEFTYLEGTYGIFYRVLKGPGGVSKGRG